MIFKRITKRLGKEFDQFSKEFYKVVVRKLIDFQLVFKRLGQVSKRLGKEFNSFSKGSLKDSVRNSLDLQKNFKGLGPALIHFQSVSKGFGKALIDF